jgi:hypothetical protein
MPRCAKFDDRGQRRQRRVSERQIVFAEPARLAGREGNRHRHTGREQQRSRGVVDVAGCGEFGEDREVRRPRRVFEAAANRRAAGEDRGDRTVEEERGVLRAIGTRDFLGDAGIARPAVGAAELERMDDPYYQVEPVERHARSA